MPQTKKPKWPALLLGMLTLLLQGCAHDSPSIQPPSVAPPRIPVLPSEARVSKVQTPSMCSPLCSQGLTTLRESWLPTAIDSESPASPAKPPTSPYSLGSKFPK